VASVFLVSSEGPPHLVASYDTQGGAEELFYPDPHRDQKESADCGILVMMTLVGSWKICNQGSSVVHVYTLYSWNSIQILLELGLGSLDCGEAANHSPIAESVAAGSEVVAAELRLLLLLGLSLLLLMKSSGCKFCRFGAGKDIADQIVINLLGQLDKNIENHCPKDIRTLTPDYCKVFIISLDY
jgi:hypothetical protein